MQLALLGADYNRYKYGYMPGTVGLGSSYADLLAQSRSDPFAYEGFSADDKATFIAGAESDDSLTAKDWVSIGTSVVGKGLDVLGSWLSGRNSSTAKAAGDKVTSGASSGQSLEQIMAGMTAAMAPWMIGGAAVLLLAIFMMSTRGRR